MGHLMQQRSKPFSFMTLVQTTSNFGKLVQLSSLRTRNMQLVSNQEVSEPHMTDKPSVV